MNKLKAMRVPKSSLKPQISTSSVDRIYDQVKLMVINYEFHPGKQLNEVELSERLGVSRTPLREVLNRLVAERLLEFIPRHGFSCPQLEPTTIYELYEVRSGIESATASLAAQRASDAEIQELITFWNSVCENPATPSSLELVKLDEEFHLRLATLSQNSELQRILQNVNDRLHYVRQIFMESSERRAGTYTQHQTILQALQKRDAETCAHLMRSHISDRLEQLVEVIKEGVARIYLR
jgi:DNA-binding GntR family transcriptional regulator